jgi:hypothetical protein
MEIYNARDYLGKAFYVLKFDQSGTKVKEDGICGKPECRLAKS